MSEDASWLITLGNRVEVKRIINSMENINLGNVYFFKFITLFLGLNPFHATAFWMAVAGDVCRTMSFI